MTDKNTILAIVLSALVLIGWQIFFGFPQMEKQKQIAQQQAQERSQQPANPATTPGSAPQQPGTAPQAPGQPTAAPGQPVTREAALAASPRVRIDTPRLAGSISLKGGRIDDLALVQYRETVDPTVARDRAARPLRQPAAVLCRIRLGRGGGHDDENARAGYAVAAGGQRYAHRRSSGDAGLRQRRGLEFRRTVAVDDKYLFTIKDEVANKSAAPVTLYPYALVSRHGTPHTLGYYILHEGLIGVLGDQGLKEETYAKLEEKKSDTFNGITNAWLGITDKYWAAALIPDTDAKLTADFTFKLFGSTKTYQADYFLDQRTIAPGATTSVNARLFAGAKEVAIVDGYDKELKLNRFELLIDWGYFYFITKNLFLVMDWIYHQVGNFGLAILIVTVLIKTLFFPLANKSYASMAKMKAVQPEMTAIRERYADDKMKQQQAMMELYKKEKINPIAGCLPIVIQIPVFFALYKVLFVTIEMRHAPFFGWIKDLAAPDPTNIFTLFGLIPWDPIALPLIGSFLHLGFWPIIMGITMWFQMKLNPAPPDPTQAMIFNWMPVIFTFMLASFPAGLVIYWAWNNTLSVAQQSVIMHKHGAKIELFDNLKALFVRKKKAGG